MTKTTSNLTDAIPQTVFVNQWNAKFRTRKLKVDALPSLTVPDQTMSLKTILDRYANGGSLMGYQGIYDEDETQMGVRLEALDLSEIHAIAQQNQFKIAELKNEAVAFNNKKIEADKARIFEEAVNKEIEKRLAEKEKSTNVL